MKTAIIERKLFGGTCVNVGCIPTKALVASARRPYGAAWRGIRRPALVLSPKTYNQATSLALMGPITSRVKGYPFETLIPEGLKVSGVVLSDHLKSLDWRARNAAFADKAPEGVVADVRLKLQTLL